MKNRTGRGSRSGGSRVPIDHGRLVDGFGEMVGRTHYEDRVLPCGRCGVPFTFTARDQKYVHEVRGVPFKMANRGGAFCTDCVRLRAAQNRATRALRNAQRLHQHALRVATEKPDDPRALLAAAATRMRNLGSHPRRASATEVVHLARRARRLDPCCSEALLWEARGLRAAGHPRAAIRALEALLERLGDRGDAALRAAALTLLAELAPET